LKILDELIMLFLLVQLIDQTVELVVPIGDWQYLKESFDLLLVFGDYLLISLFVG